MRTIPILLIFIICNVFISCKKDCQSFESHTVHFFNTHEDFTLKQAEFETRTETMLVKEAHLSLGATFETVSEQVLLKEGYTERKISESQKINIVVNAETNTIQEIDCHHFFDEANFISTEIPNIYVTRTYIKVIDPGFGIEVPATYETRTYELLKSDSEIISNNDMRSFSAINFSFPDHMTIQEYVEDQLKMQGIQNCIEGDGYEIID